MATDTDSTRPQMVKRNDAYTGLLAISFLAMVGGCVLLYLEYEQYDGRTPPAMPKIDVPGTLKPAPTAPKETPPPRKEVENPENPMPMPMPMPMMEKDKDKSGRLPVQPDGDALVIPVAIPEPARRPGNEQANPIVPASATVPIRVLPPESLEIPSPPTIPSQHVPAAKVNSRDLPPEPAPIIPIEATEPQPNLKGPISPPIGEPSLDAPPPLQPKPFIPPM